MIRPNRSISGSERKTEAGLQAMLSHKMPMIPAANFKRLFRCGYRFGHLQTDSRLKRLGHPSSGRKVVRAEKCYALINGYCPAEITKERFEITISFRAQPFLNIRLRRRSCARFR